MWESASGGGLPDLAEYEVPVNVGKVYGGDEEGSAVAGASCCSREKIKRCIMPI